MIADEVQTGFCRTGKMFASDYWKDAGCAPDILTMAKSIAAGMPLSAVTAREEIMEAVPVGTIGGTYCGNAVSCAAALKAIEFMEQHHLDQRAVEIGNKVMSRYKKMKEKYEAVGDVRGLGSMIGIEFVKDKDSKEPDPDLVKSLIQECVQNGLLVESAGIYGNVIRFLAPLVITDEQLEAGLDILEKAVAKFSKEK